MCCNCDRNNFAKKTHVENIHVHWTNGTPIEVIMEAKRPRGYILGRIYPLCMSNDTFKDMLKSKELTAKFIDIRLMNSVVNSLDFKFLLFNKIYCNFISSLSTWLWTYRWTSKRRNLNIVRTSISFSPNIRVNCHRSPNQSNEESGTTRDT